MISFGTRSILLLIGTVHGLVLAALLLRAPGNRVANRLLALLLTLVALRIVPYIIGFAGFYDAYPWLTYLPYDWSLGYGAVIWLYARVICSGGLPAHWRWHLVPAAVQGVYYCVLFVQPLTFKNAYNGTIHDPIVAPIESALTMLSMAGYLVLAGRDYSRYQRWLDADLSNREDFRLDWLRLFLVAFGVTLLLWGVTLFADAFVKPLDYFDRFPLYLWFSALIYALGLGGLRNANKVYPRPASAVGGREDTVTDIGDVAEPGTTAPLERQQDWAAMGQKWSTLVRQSDWWRDPDLTAPLLARHLATNTTYLSRALNDGLGQNFNEFVNRIRVEAVQAELSRPESDRDVLVIALDAGFNSKASFNRVFKRVTGQTPTEFRRQNESITSQLQ
ncbi:MAG: AraC family transcriptional regulator [Gemmatimonadaceae bacterium]|nr:AraC family transcriptional regulator [Gemmatimonadaceae bacterium]